MKSFVAVTVDTEFSTHKDDIGIRGRVDGSDYGVPMIKKMLAEHGLKATFFVDVYTEKSEYTNYLKDVCSELKEDGHELALHTHPNGLFDPNRGSMVDYNPAEQIDIIAKGMQIFDEWFSAKPLSHRAGDWAANFYTLDALIEHGIRVDSSMFFGWPHCKLNDQPLSRNAVVMYKNKLMEIPASCFQCVPIKIFTPYRLISTDQNSFNETWSLINTMQVNGYPVITTVFHSFSFLKWNKERSEYGIIKNRIHKFEQLLKSLANSQKFEVATIAKISKMLSKDLLTIVDDSVPKRGWMASIDRLADRVISRL